MEWRNCLYAQQTLLEVYENIPMSSVGNPEEENVHNGLLQNHGRFPVFGTVSNKLAC